MKAVKLKQLGESKAAFAQAGLHPYILPALERFSVAPLMEPFSMYQRFTPDVLHLVRVLPCGIAVLSMSRGAMMCSR